MVDATTVGVTRLPPIDPGSVLVVWRFTCGQAQAIAATCLRMCGVPEERIARAAGSVEKRLA